MGLMWGTPSSIAGGDANSAGGIASAILGRSGNATTLACQSIPTTPASC